LRHVACWHSGVYEQNVAGVARIIWHYKVGDGEYKFTLAMCSSDSITLV